MTKSFNCKECNNNAAYTLVSFDADQNIGDFRKCNLCDHISPMQRRYSAKKKQEEAKLNALVAWLDEQM